MSRELALWFAKDNTGQITSIRIADWEETNGHSGLRHAEAPGGSHVGLPRERKEPFTGAERLGVMTWV